MEFRIKEARERVGLSQKDLAKALNIKPTTFNGYETGAHDPKSDVLVAIAKACNTSVDFLLGLESFERTKKSPVPAEPVTGESEGIRAALFYKQLISAGYLREGEDFTDAQIRILKSVLEILDATFPKRTLPEGNETRKIG